MNVRRDPVDQLPDEAPDAVVQRPVADGIGTDLRSMRAE